MENKLELFGKEISLKTHDCILFDKKDEAKEILNNNINLVIRTKFCNAKCAFCTYADDASKFSEKRLREVLTEINSKTNINKIAISGGEPMLHWENFKTIVKTIREFSNAELTITTDGFRWKQFFEDPIYKEFKYIQLSRHHLNDSINDEIFKCKTPTSEDIKWASRFQTHSRQIQLRCNLIKGYTEDVNTVFEYLDWANRCDINDVGLVSLMPVNDYSKENYIYFHIKDLIGDNFFLTKEWKQYSGGCECFNYVYLPEEDFRMPMKVYHKNTYDPNGDSKTNTLVFDGKNLFQGYSLEKIY